MDQRLKDFVLQGFINLPEKAKNRLLYLLKDQPEIMFQIILNNLDQWITELLTRKPEIDHIHIHDRKQCCQEILEYLQEHYAQHLKSIS